MKKRIYTEVEIELLKKCKYIVDIKYGTQVEYDPLFKIWCVMMKLDMPELTAKEIFDRGGMNTNILNRITPRRRISDWMYNYKRYGIDYFLPKDEIYKTTSDFNKKLLEVIKERFDEA